MASQQVSQKGMDWLVSGRGYAIIMVYIGHVLLAYYSVGLTEPMTVGRMLQVGVIPFFIVLSGAFYSSSQLGFLAYFRFKLLQRYLPVLFFGLLVIPIYALLNQRMFNEALNLSPLYLLGIPSANWPTWFLIALMVSELCFYGIIKRCKNKTILALLALALFFLGCFYNAFKNSQGGWVFYLGMVWSVGAVPFFLSCMILGRLCRRHILKLRKLETWRACLFLLASIFILAIFSHINDRFARPEKEGIFRFITDEMVVIFIGQYGNAVYFLLASLAGIAFCFYMARVLPVTRLTVWIGDKSLLLFCLNGAFHHAVNPLLAKNFPIPANTWYWGLSYAVVIALISLLILVPVVAVLEKTLPQLLGRPMLKGPLLPALYKAEKTQIN
ncbi:MAG: acyltransferase [Pseudomonadales bacterium]|nr:acyltransferase [Pseudomonadales bacterium]